MSKGQFINPHLAFNRIPLIGITIFCLLFVYASTLYPGGSQFDISSTGFSWQHNYWCNLLNLEAMNGMPNPARNISILAMLTLCLSLMTFFFQFAQTYLEQSKWHFSVKYGGILSMLSASFIFTKYHDLLTIVSSVFGLFAVLGIVITIYKSNLLSYKLTGILCLVLILFNNLIYYSGQHLNLLPLIQKLTILAVLVWILGLNQKIRKRIVLRESSKQ